MPSMAKTFREWNPEQAVMFPPTTLDFVEADDVVHFIRNLVVEELDLREITDQYQEERGYPPFHPVMMTALTAIFGLLPAALSTRIGSQTQRPLAIVVVGGMITTLFLTRYLMPVLYTFYGNREPPEAARGLAH